MEDGWFCIGDCVLLDFDGCLCLVGCVKELVNINGVKMFIVDIQLFFEQVVQGKEVVLCFFVFLFNNVYMEQVMVVYVLVKIEWEVEDVVI